MIFRQLFETESSTYTYLIACTETGEAMLVDPVLERAEEDLSIVRDLGLTLALTLETHIHADHITAAARLRGLTGCAIACPAMEELPLAQIGVSEAKALDVGNVRVQPIHTPGHTASHHSYYIDTGIVPMVLTGDALLIDGCGRTDFQGGDARALYESIHGKIFTLPPETLVYPGHDYQHRQVSTIGQEKARNPRLGAGRSADDFVQIMRDLDLPRPKKIDVAVPANMRCGQLDAVDPL